MNSSMCLFALTFMLFAVSPTTARELHVSKRSLTDYPANFQYRSISAAAKQLGPGDVLIVHGGIYREEIVVDASGSAEQPITIRAADGERVIISGADRIRDWTAVSDEPGVYSVSWPYAFNTDDPHNADPDDDFHRLIGRCEQVFVSSYALRQVLERDQLARGTFYVDLDDEQLYIQAADSTGVSSKDVCVEASTRQSLLTLSGNHVHLKGIRFRYAANRAQNGAVDATGNNLVLEDCIFEYMNSSGAAFRGPDTTVRNCSFQFNGQLGFGAKSAHRLRMIGCNVNNNNIKGFDRNWEAGGNKIVLTRGAIFEHCTFADNRGHGIWYDIGNEDSEVSNCLIANNENAGIFYEISFGLHAHDNVIVNNGLTFAPSAWGANAGISLSSSPNCRIERNLLLGNKEGFAFREQTRTTPRIDRRAEKPVWNHDQIVSHNIFAYNRDAQVWGWFDIPDERHWPKADQTSAAASTSQPNREAVPTTPPANLSLEKLKFDLRDNFYCLGPGQTLFRWGVPWKKHKAYHDLAEVQADLSFAKDSAMEGLRLKNCSAYDLRVPADSRAVAMECYPRGSVPGVVLGVLGTAGE